MDVNQAVLVAVNAIRVSGALEVGNLGSARGVGGMPVIADPGRAAGARLSRAMNTNAMPSTITVATAIGAEFATLRGAT